MEPWRLGGEAMIGGVLDVYWDKQADGAAAMQQHHGDDSCLPVDH